jgi:hypothetical protein
MILLRRGLFVTWPPSPWASILQKGFATQGCFVGWLLPKDPVILIGWLECRPSILLDTSILLFVHLGLMFALLPSMLLGFL